MRTALVWLCYAPNAYRDQSGRFDVMHNGHLWVAYDCDRPKRSEHHSLALARTWCERRAKAV